MRGTSLQLGRWKGGGSILRHHDPIRCSIADAGLARCRRRCRSAGRRRCTDRTARAFDRRTRCRSAGARCGVRRRAPAARLGRGRGRRADCRRGTGCLSHQARRSARDAAGWPHLDAGPRRRPLAPAAASLQRNHVERPGAEGAAGLSRGARGNARGAHADGGRHDGTRPWHRRRRLRGYGIEARDRRRADSRPAHAGGWPGDGGHGQLRTERLRLGVHRASGRRRSRRCRRRHPRGAQSDGPRRGPHQDLRGLPLGPERRDATHVHRERNHRHRRGGEEQRPSRGRARLDARGHAPRHRRWRGDDRARRRRHARGLEADGREGRRLLSGRSARPMPPPSTPAGRKASSPSRNASRRSASRSRQRSPRA